MHSLRAQRRRREPRIDGEESAVALESFPLIVTPVHLPWFEENSKRGERAARGSQQTSPPPASADVCTCMYMHGCACMYMRMCMYVHVAHAYSHRRTTYKHTCMHTYIHTCAYMSPPPASAQASAPSQPPLPLEPPLTAAPHVLFVGLAFLSETRS